MESNLFWWWFTPIILLPVFFAMGWFAARVDMKTVLRQAKSIPSEFYKSLDALVDRKTSIAANTLNDVLDRQFEIGKHLESLELGLTLGKLYRIRGENDKAISLHTKLLSSPDIVSEQEAIVKYELAQDYQNAGLVDRAEQQFEQLLDTYMAKQAKQILLNIYQQDRDWEKAIALAKSLSFDQQTYQFEIAQFYCEMAQTTLIHTHFAEAKKLALFALNENKKCTRANMILGNIEVEQENYIEAIKVYSSIEQQNYEYLSMIGENLYDAYSALDKAEEGLNVLIGYMHSFPQLDLIKIIYEKALPLWGESKANNICADLIRNKPNIEGIYRLLGFKISDISAEWRSDLDMIRSVISRQVQKSFMYRCKHCHFKSQVFFWHCPACNKWETFTPNRIDI